MFHLFSSKLRSDPEFIKIFSCPTQPSMEFFLLINVRLLTTIVVILTVVVILTFISIKIAFQAYLSLKEAEFLDIFILLCI